MKKAAYWFLTIILANILFFRFNSCWDIYRMIAFIALLGLVYAIPKFAAALAQRFMERKFSHNDDHSENPQIIKSIKKKTTFITTSSLLLLIVFHTWGYYAYFKSEKEDLSRSGIYAGAVVTEKRLECRSENLYRYYIYYSYKYNGKFYFHNCQNNTMEVGDSIIVKFLPDNPDHHIIMDKIL